jgi:PAS domain S-box-containing protein
MLLAVPDLMFVLDKDGVYVDFHAPDPTLLVVPADRLIGRNVREVFPADVGERVVRCLAETIGVRRAPDAGVRHPIDGKLRHWEARVVPCAPDKVLSIVRDVTERKVASTRHARSARSWPTWDG